MFAVVLFLLEETDRRPQIVDLLRYSQILPVNSVLLGLSISAQDYHAFARRGYLIRHEIMSVAILITSPVEMRLSLSVILPGTIYGYILYLVLLIRLTISVETRYRLEIAPRLYVIQKLLILLCSFVQMMAFDVRLIFSALRICSSWPLPGTAAFSISWVLRAISDLVGPVNGLLLHPNTFK